jgi:acetyl esterase/lipase
LILVLAAFGLLFLLLPVVVGRIQAGRGVDEDIRYGPDRNQTLNLCASPVKVNGRMPALIMIHGGAWRSGGKKDWTDVCKRAAAAGLIGIAIDYRLADGSVKHSWPAQLIDSQLAMRWVRSHAVQYGIDPDHICAIGDSAGGHLAVFLAALDRPVAGDYSELLPTVSPQAGCAIDWFGPVNMTGFLEMSANMRQMFAGVKPAQYAEAERSASPLFDIGPHTAPILIAHGANDTFVNIDQSRALQAALTQSGVPNQLWVFQGGHEFLNADDQKRGYIDAAIAFAKNPRVFFSQNQPPD